MYNGYRNGRVHIHFNRNMEQLYATLLTKHYIGQYNLYFYKSQ